MPPSSGERILVDICHRTLLLETTLYVPSSTSFHLIKNPIALNVLLVCYILLSIILPGDSLQLYENVERWNFDAIKNGEYDGLAKLMTNTNRVASDTSTSNKTSLVQSMTAISDNYSLQIDNVADRRSNYTSGDLYSITTVAELSALYRSDHRHIMNHSDSDQWDVEKRTLTTDTTDTTNATSRSILNLLVTATGKQVNVNNSSLATESSYHQLESTVPSVQRLLVKQIHNDLIPNTTTISSSTELYEDTFDDLSILSTLVNQLYTDSSVVNGSTEPNTIILEPDLRIHHPVLAVLLGLICIVVVFGNVLTMLSIYKERYLHTVTNYFVASLAAADCLVGAIVMPFSVVHEVMNKWWIFGQDW